MEENSKNESNGKISRVIKRAAAWKISDSDADSDVESCQTRTVTLTHQAADALDDGICDHATEEELKSWVGVSEPSELLLPTSPQQVATSFPSPNTRRRRTPEEIEAGRARAEARKLEREIKKTEKERRKAQEVLEKRRRKETADALKLLRPNQCLKYMIICIDPGLLEDPGSDVLMEAFGSLECKYYIEPQEVPCSITWRRNTVNSLSSTDGPMVKSEEENEVLVLVDPRDFLKRLFSLTQSLREAPSGSRPDLSQLLPLDCLEGPSLKSFSLAVIGLGTSRWYNHHQGRQWVLRPGEQSRKEDPWCQPSPELSMTQQEIEEGLVGLQLWGNTEVLFLDTWQDFSQHVSALTKAIAKRPYKKQLATQLFSFCTDGGWSGGVQVEKDGTGLRQAYEECSTEKERLLLLSDIQVKAEDSRRERRIGPDLSRRVYLFMTSTNPDLVLDLSA
ncbi:probable crossover junction endonuclease EME2 isoform X2 [Emydura macquarii macquarii]|uniref:probable crossover junction endonuclease EME2 isoform X2 n=1 Tax=Emydura macquarii macquarii TaxID=1129001 RepID=UPI003529EC54